MAGICRDPKHSDLFEKLCDKNAANTNKPIFRTYADLIAFSALVGFNRSRCSPLSERSNEIPQRVFQNQNLDGLIYLIAMMEKKTGDVLREQNESEAWQLFERYSNGGLEIIRETLADNPNDFDGVSSLLSFIKEEAISQSTTNPESERIEINF